MNREIFYNQILPLFGGEISVSQWEGIDAILNEYENNHPDLPLSALAYVLATPFHETDRTMQPIEEYGRGNGRAYGKADPVTKKIYFGRGLVQLTWKNNYEKAGKRFGVDLVNHPEKALEMELAVKILFWGMIEGKFTGARLSRFFKPGLEPTRKNFYDARAIINGTDKANKIADEAQAFYAALKAASKRS